MRFKQYTGEVQGNQDIEQIDGNFVHFLQQFLAALPCAVSLLAAFIGESRSDQEAAERKIGPFVLVFLAFLFACFALGANAAFAALTTDCAGISGRRS